MLIRLRPGQFRDSALAVLRDQRNALQNINGDAARVLQRYLEWVTSATDQLRSVVMPTEVDRLTSSPISDRLLSIFFSIDQGQPLGLERSRVVNGLVHSEKSARIAVFDEAIDGLQKLARRWSGNERFVVGDTNFFLLHSVPFGDPGFADVVAGEHYHGVRLILPMVVVEELDRAKLGRDELRGRAQITLAQLDALFASQQDVADLEPKSLKPMPGGVSVPFGGVVAELLFDPPGHIRMSKADDEIVDRALTVRALASRQVTLVTYDTHMSMKARHAGLEVVKLRMSPRQPSTKPVRHEREERAATRDERKSS